MPGCGTWTGTSLPWPPPATGCSSGPSGMRSRSPLSQSLSRVAAPAAGDVARGLRIVSPGIQSLIQDLGRHGHSGLGVSAAGALDRASLRRANRLVGNAPTAAAIETVAIETVTGGLRVQAVSDQVLAVTGAPSALSIESAPDSAGETWHRPVPMAAPFALLDGETLSLGAPQSGFRSYLAVRGGVDAALVLGSRSTDTMSGIGPAPLTAGQVLAAGGATAESGVVGQPELQPDYPGTGVTVLDVVPGPRADWFDQAALDSFTAQDWSVRRSPTGSACGWTGPRCSEAARANCPAKAPWPAPSRSRRRACPCSSWPTIPSRAATR